MAKIKLVGAIVDNDTAKIYQWIGFDAISAKTVERAIKALEDGEELEIDLNSPGGYANVGAEIYTMLRQASADGHPVTVNVVGEACSAATVLMCGADKVLASDVAVFMFHNASVAAQGKARDMRSAQECLEQTDETIVNAYELKTGRTRDELHDLIDAETWMSPQRAMEYGFVDGRMFEEEEDPEGQLNIQNQISQTMQRMASSTELIPEDKLAILREAMIKDIAGDVTEPAKNDINSVAVKNKSKGGHKMTLQEVYQEHPELKDEVSGAIRSAVAESEAAQEQTMKDAVMAERQRIKSIEAIAGAIPAELVEKAKYAEPCDAKDLAFQALSVEKKTATDYMSQAMNDSKESGAEDVNPIPSDAKDGVEDVEVFAAYINKARGKEGKKNG